eukprot:gene23485-26587_t
MGPNVAVSYNCATSKVNFVSSAALGEAERIYLSSHVVSSKLNQDEIEAKFSFAKQNNVAHSEEFETE